MVDSTLPPSVTALERAIEAHMEKKLSILPESILKDLYDPQKVPAAFLPFLAEHLSADAWSSDWSEETKRKVIESLIATHKVKGTFGGVAKALKALDIDAKISQWFEYEAQNGGRSDSEVTGVGVAQNNQYYFKIDVEITSQGLTDIEQDTILLTIYEAKNLRSWLEKLVFWLSSKASLFAAAATMVGEHIEVLPFIQTNIELQNPNPFMAGMVQALETLTIKPRNTA